MEPTEDIWQVLDSDRTVNIQTDTSVRGKVNELTTRLETTLSEPINTPNLLWNKASSIFFASQNVTRRSASRRQATHVDDKVLSEIF